MNNNDIINAEAVEVTPVQEENNEELNTLLKELGLASEVVEKVPDNATEFFLCDPLTGNALKGKLLDAVAEKFIQSVKIMHLKAIDNNTDCIYVLTENNEEITTQQAQQLALIKDRLVELVRKNMSTEMINNVSNRIGSVAHNTVQTGFRAAVTMGVKVGVGLFNTIIEGKDVVKDVVTNDSSIKKAKTLLGKNDSRRSSSRTSSRR